MYLISIQRLQCLSNILSRTDTLYGVWILADMENTGKYEDGWKVTTQHAAEDEIYALEKICELQGVEKLDLLGWSWGTMTTSKVASQRPDL